MNSTQVACFLNVAESHSFTRAAEALFLSQQSVSRQIALLEEEVGVKLFDRTTGFITLTPAGQQYYAALSTAERQLAILKEKLAGERRRQLLRFRIGFSEWLNPFGRLQDAIDAFRRTYPDTVVEQVQMDNEELSRQLMEGRLDVAFFSEGQLPHMRDLRGEPVAEGEMRLYAPEDVLADTDPAAVDRCWSLPMLMVPAWEWSYLEQKLVGGQEQAEFALHPNQILTLPNLHSLEAAMRFGRCVTVGEVRFGVFNRIPGLGSLTLPLREHLMLARTTGGEHPLYGAFAELVRSTLAE